MSTEMTCKHCGRTIVLDGDVWVDPEAKGDDNVWRETCDANDTFEATHDPIIATKMEPALLIEFDKHLKKLGIKSVDDLPEVPVPKTVADLPVLPDDQPELPEKFIHTIFISGESWDIFADFVEMAAENALVCYVNGQKVALESFDRYGTQLLHAVPLAENNHIISGEVVFKPEDLKVIRFP